MRGWSWITSGRACSGPYRWARCSLQALQRRVRNSQDEATPVSAFYNEIDPYAAAWLRNLIKAGHIAPGIVDERSIEDICPDELVDYTQCHFFAGVGVWSYALRRAGWDDARPVWTGSCPCQPFSSAGKGTGFADQRHLWPAFQHLISESRPAAVFGEQVAGKDVDAWIDLVQDDLEALGYTFGAVAFPSASIGAPHIRDRTYWVGYTNDTGPQGYARHGSPARRQGPGRPATAPGLSGGLANATGKRLDGWRPGLPGNGRDTARLQSERLCDAGDGLPGPVNGLWRSADWLTCRDGRWRPVEPSTFPLAHGAPARVGRLRAYGNAINAEQARIFIESVMETT
ncbi:DNA cytosine methyltransferase [Janthinobacterium sp. FW305-129]|uniref:DNA cytosine methyltransferase n=1 Tax=Janthinobacterium sp. FW305-129 TaxID=2775054 RepID=UPI001E6128EC|nr:DNA cytosine methyltransferase [Janthinobacterium sp. FW305-129]MCC7596756.1 DNA cytosine methyltransferase [Janthinobacterium sp. FW305-129]